VNVGLGCECWVGVADARSGGENTAMVETELRFAYAQICSSAPRVDTYVYLCVCARVRACMRVCVRVCVRACMRACVRVRR